MVLKTEGSHPGQPRADLKLTCSNCGFKATTYTYFLKERGIILSDFSEDEEEL